jgi:hypothetical protein
VRILNEVSAMADDVKLVCVGEALSVEEARRMEAILKDAGIPAYLTGAAAALAARGPESGNITVEVAEADHEHALLVLQRHTESASSARRAEETEVNPFVTLEVYYEPEEAEFAAQILRAKDIPCELKGTAPLENPFVGKAIVGYQLRVREENAEQACALLGMSLVEETEEDEPDEGDETDTPPATAIRHLRSDVTANRRVETPPGQEEAIRSREKRLLPEEVIGEADLPNLPNPREQPPKPKARTVVPVPRKEPTRSGEKPESGPKEADISEGEHPREAPHPAETDVTRAFRSALFGLVVLPLFFHLYTFFLIYNIISKHEDLDANNTAKIYISLLIASVRTLLSAYLFGKFGWDVIEWVLLYL